MDLGHKKPSITVNQKEKYLNHPEFRKRFHKSTEGYKVPDNLIPDITFQLAIIMQHVSYASLNMDIDTYCELAGEIPVLEMEWGLLHKACNIIVSYSPEMLQLDTLSYRALIRSCVVCIDHINEFMAIKTDEVIKELIISDSITGKH